MILSPRKQLDPEVIADDIAAGNVVVSRAGPCDEPLVPATPTPRPTPSSSTTPESPASFTIGTLHYNANSCWKDSFLDPEGHQIDGVPVAFWFTATNEGGTAGAPVITINADTDVSLLSTDWGGSTYTKSPDGMSIDAAMVRPGASRGMRLEVLFEGPLDPHYTVTIGDESWTYWTSSSVC